MSSDLSCKDYLLAAFEVAKKGNPVLTISTYAARLGLGASTLKMILSGKRKLTVHQALKVARALRLPEEESVILETLALRDSATTTWERAYFGRRLQRQKKELKVRTIRTSDKTLLGDPLALPLLVYLMERGAGVKGSEASSGEIDYADLAKRFGAKADRLRDLVRHFDQSGVLSASGDGKHHVSFDRISHKIQQKAYVKSMLGEALRRVDEEYDKEPSAFACYTLATSEDALNRLREDLKSVMNRYMSESPSQDGEWQIAQACFQLFPVVRL
jgi:transcriptional regulator with XRE-family HTH domain